MNSTTQTQLPVRNSICPSSAIDARPPARTPCHPKSGEHAMTHTQSRILRGAAAGLLAAVALAASTASLAASPAFESRMSALITKVGNDPSYKRIPLQSSADKEWFNERSEDLFRNKITKEQFVSEGASKFPGYEASFATVADFMTTR
jgi:hypothetical protein